MAEEAHRARSPVLLAVLLVLLNAVVPLMVWPETNVELGPEHVAQLLVLVYAGTRLSLLLHAAQPRWMQAMFFIFAYLWLGVAGLVQVLSGENPFRVAQPSGAQFTAAIVVIVGMVSYDVGVFFMRRRLTLPPEREPRPRRVVARSRMIVFTVLALTVSPILIDRQGGWSTLFLTRFERGRSLGEAGLFVDSNALGSIVLALAQLIPFVALLSLLRLMQEQPSRRRDARWLGVGVLLLFLNLVVSNPLSSARFWTGTVLIGLVLSLPILSRPLGFRTVLVGLIAVLAVAFPYADTFRNPGAPQASRPLTQLFTDKLDYDVPAAVVNGVLYREERGGTDGRQMIGAALAFVPRSVWPDKPVATGPLLARFIGYDFENLSAPLWIEAYLDGGYPLLVLVFIVLGLASAKLDRSYVLLHDRWPTALAVLSGPPLALCSLFLIRGSLLSTLPVFALLTLALVVVTRPGARTAANAASIGAEAPGAASPVSLIRDDPAGVGRRT